MRRHLREQLRSGAIRLYVMTLTSSRETPVMWGMRSSSLLHIPNISVIGTIPYRSRDIYQMPPGYYRFIHLRRRLSHRLFSNAAMALETLFESGDRHFPNMDKMEFREESKDNYRGSLWIRNVKIYLDSKENICGLEGIIGSSVGSTPVRLSLLERNLSRKNISSMSGQSRPLIHEMKQINGNYILTCRLEFRLGYLGDLLQSILTGRAAPWVWFETNICFKVISGEAQIRLVCEGSSMPSQIVFAGTHPIYAHDMTTLNVRDIYDFFQANPFVGPIGIGVGSFGKARSMSNLAPRRAGRARKQYLPVSRK